jgi:DNA-binding CsgD family transcriptional regulator
MPATEAVHTCLLGGFRVSVGTRTIGEDEWRLRKAASLLKLLVLSPEHRLHREVVMELLWPDLGMRSAANNLRGVLHAARRTLEPATATPPVPPCERSDRDSNMAAARAGLDAAAWAEGQAMSLGEVVRYALGPTEPTLPPVPVTGRVPPGKSLPGLTRREREVAALVGKGLANRRIASELVLSERTVETHVRNILKKLGLESRAQLAALITTGSGLGT